MRIPMKKNLSIYTIKKRRIQGNCLSKVTLATVLGSLLSIIIVAALKYLISGEVRWDFADFYGNVALGITA